MQLVEDILNHVPHEQFSNSTWLVSGTENIAAALIMLNGNTIYDKSYFGKLDYWDVEGYHYQIKNCRFAAITSSIVTLHEGLNPLYNIDISPTKLQHLRINDYGAYAGFYLDCYRDARVSIIFHVGSVSGYKNERISELLNNYRVQFRKGAFKEAYATLRQINTLKNIEATANGIFRSSFRPVSINVAQVGEGYLLKKSFNKHCRQDQYNTVSAKQQPLTYEEAENIRKRLNSVGIPFLVISDAYLAEDKSLILVSDGHEDIGNWVYQRLFEDVVYIKSVVAVDENQSGAFDNYNDLYNLATNQWISDFLYEQQCPSDNPINLPALSDNINRQGDITPIDEDEGDDEAYVEDSFVTDSKKELCSEPSLF